MCWVGRDWIVALTRHGMIESSLCDKGLYISQMIIQKPIVNITPTISQPPS